MKLTKTLRQLRTSKTPTELFRVYQFVIAYMTSEQPLEDLLKSIFPDTLPPFTE